MATAAEGRPMTAASIDVVHAYERPRDPAAPRLFLAGPTPRSGDVPSWRPEAVDTIARTWVSGPLTVLNPEPRGAFSDDYTDQYEWEFEHLEAADVIMFWVARRMDGMPALTTNIEWGHYCKSGRVVMGAPPWGERTRYMQHQARRYGVPVTSTLEDTVRASYALLAQRRTATGSSLAQRQP
jgi:Nucleoside 2-deoxyribosyltransferase like